MKALGGKNSYESIKRYEDKAYDKVLVRMPKGRKDEIQTFAAQTGESVNGFINRAIGEAMGESPQQPAGAPQGDGAILTPAALKTAQEAAQRAGETVPAFVGRAVETQAQRDKVMQAMRPKEKAPKKIPGLCKCFFYWGVMLRYTYTVIHRNCG